MIGHVAHQLVMLEAQRGVDAFQQLVFLASLHHVEAVLREHERQLGLAGMADRRPVVERTAALNDI